MIFYEDSNPGLPDPDGFKTIREYKLLIFSDEIHCRDEIISQVMKSACCSYEVAEYICQVMEDKGSAAASIGPLEYVKKVATKLSEISIPFKILRSAPNHKNH